jgi:hypothetical protein
MLTVCFTLPEAAPHHSHQLHRQVQPHRSLRKDLPVDQTSSNAVRCLKRRSAAPARRQGPRDIRAATPQIAHRYSFFVGMVVYLTRFGRMRLQKRTSMQRQMDTNPGVTTQARGNTLPLAMTETRSIRS